MADREACERLNADLQEVIAASQSGNRARPVILFDHKPGAAAAVPTGFEWDDKRGILLKVDWTQAGREAIEGGNYGYISPAFRLAKGSDQITGLQPGVEVGSLVNDPAFQRNECIAAARAEFEDISAAFLPPFEKVEKAPNEGENKGAANGGGENNEHKRMETIKKMLGLGADATPADIAAAISALQKKGAAGQKRIEEVEAECNEHKKALDKHKEKSADSFIERLKYSGKVKPHDEETLKAAREMYMNAPEQTERIYASMQAVAPSIDAEDEDIRANRVPEGCQLSDMSLEDCYAGMNF